MPSIDDYEWDVDTVYSPEATADLHFEIFAEADYDCVIICMRDDEAEWCYGLAPDEAIALGKSLINKAHSIKLKEDQ